jgi:L-fuconolactonase
MSQNHIYQNGTDTCKSRIRYHAPKLSTFTEPIINQSNHCMQTPIIDAHLHLWDIERFSYPWLESVPGINRNFTIADYLEESKGASPEAMVFVQCECKPASYKEEIKFISEIAAQEKRIKGIVCWFPLELSYVADDLVELVKNPLIRGIRRLEESPSLYQNGAFIENLGLLHTHNLSFDICLKAHQLPAAIHLVNKQPNVKYMLDHLGKPAIESGEIDQWKAYIKDLASNPSVFCKLSGMVTEADWNSWRIDDLRPYLSYAIEQFGFDRLVFGSDWPVVNLASSYQTWLTTFLTLCSEYDKKDVEKMLYHNALEFYKLN